MSNDLPNKLHLNVYGGSVKREYGSSNVAIKDVNAFHDGDVLFVISNCVIENKDVLIVEKITESDFTVWSNQLLEKTSEDSYKIG